ncbi:MAG TPA: hypothetical protein VII24_09620 [Pseudolabrys sp.]
MVRTPQQARRQRSRFASRVFVIDKTGALSCFVNDPDDAGSAIFFENPRWHYGVKDRSPWHLAWTYPLG